MAINPLNDISRVYLEQVATPQLDERVRPGNVETPLDKAAFKKRRRSLAGREASAEARARGHEGKEWHNTGRTYSPDEAKSRRSGMSDYERQKRYQTAEDPDSDNAADYPASKTKNPKKLRKQRAMGESAVPGKPAERLGAVTAIPKDERDAARERTLAKAKAMRDKKPKRWWDDDGDGIGWEKGEVRKEAKEVKRWWDDDGDGKGYEEGEVSGKFKKKKKLKEGFSNWREDLSEVVDDIGKRGERGVRVQEKKVRNKIKINPTMGEAVENLGGVLLEMEELDEKAYRNLGVGRVERVSSGSYQAPETTGAAAKRKKAEESKPVVAKKVETPTSEEEGRPARRRRKGSPSYDEVKAGIEAREQAKKKKRKKKVSRKSRIDDLLASIRSEGVEIDEAVKGESSERRKALADERRKGTKLLPAKEGEKYAKFKAHQIDYIDKKTKGKYIHGMTREEIELDEKTLTAAETKEKERLVKSMKDREADFERRYPGRGREVMYATATKMAKRITEQQLDEIAPLVAGGLALGGAALAGAAIKRAYDAAQSGVNAAKSGAKVKPGQTGIAGAAYNMQKRNQQLQQLMNQSYQPEGDQIDEFAHPSVIDRIKKGKKPSSTFGDNLSSPPGSTNPSTGGRRPSSPLGPTNQNNSYEPEGEMVDEARAEEKRGLGSTGEQRQRQKSGESGPRGRRPVTSYSGGQNPHLRGKGGGNKERRRSASRRYVDQPGGIYADPENKQGEGRYAKMQYMKRDMSHMHSRFD